MSGFQKILLLGTGPASIQLAVALKKQFSCTLGIVGRESVRSESFFEAIRQTDGFIGASIQNEKHRPLAGECFIDRVFKGYESIEGEWDTLILAVTTDAYIDVLKQMNDNFIKQVKCIILVSPTFGSNLLVKHYVRQLHADTEVVSFSTYLGDTRWMHDQPSNHVITTGVKKKVYMGSTSTPSEHVDRLCKMYEQLGIALEVMPSAIEAGNEKYFFICASAAVHE